VTSRPSSSTLGATLVDLVMGMGVITLLCSLGAPVVSGVVEAARLRHGAGFVATRFRLARSHAAAATVAVGVVFDRSAQGWAFRVCEDGNGNGLRRAEIAAGVDACVEGPHDVSVLFPGVQVAADPTLRGPDGEPGSADAVRFGASDLASFSPSGTCSAGSLWLRSPRGEQLIVRVAGVTGRVRILRWDAAAGAWRDA
jgi:hypothetical protein